MRVLLLAGSLGLASCASPAPPVRASAAPAPTPPAPVVAPSGTSPSPGPSGTSAAPGTPEVVRALCGARSACKLEKRESAGRGVHGEPLEVVTLRMAPAEDEADLHCTPQESWLLTGGDPRTAQLLLHLCNDGYGAAGVGEDDIQVQPNRLVHAQSGGSNWRWTNTTDLVLSPLHIAGQGEAGNWVLGPNEESGSWSWETFDGKVSWWSPPCTAGGEPPEDPEPPAGTVLFEYHPIPEVTLPADYLASGWKTTALGACAAVADGAHGYVIHGHSAPADASLRVVASSGDTLVVEVHDDRFTGPTDKWLFDDHLELWVSDQEASYMDHCLDGSVHPVQWGIRIADGKVFPAYGAPKDPPVVERVMNGTTARMKLRLPRGTKALTVVYSDGDGGRSQEALLATSRLAFGSLPTLGGRRAIAAEEAVCEVRAGRLEPKITRTFSPDTPVIGP